MNHILLVLMMHGIIQKYIIAKDISLLMYLISLAEKKKQLYKKIPYESLQAWKTSSKICRR